MTRRTAFLTALAGVALAALLLTGLLLSAGSGKVRGTNPTSPVFVVGKAKTFARQVEKERRPLIFPDPNERGKTIVLQYVAASGWHASEGHARDDPTCIVQWHPDERTFTDCHHTSYPEDGGGLVHYRTEIDAKGILRVDLRQSIS